MPLAQCQQMEPRFVGERAKERPHLKPVIHCLRFPELPVQQVVPEQTRRTNRISACAQIPAVCTVKAKSLIGAKRLAIVSESIARSANFF